VVVLTRVLVAALQLLVASVAVPSAALRAQAAPQPARTSSGWAYEIANRVTTPRGALVLMPGFGGSFADFSETGNAAPHRSVLADSLGSRGITLVFIAPPTGVLFGGASHMQQLEDTITEALQTIGTGTLPLAIGGFSAGGTDAILFAERCAEGRCSMPHPVRAVFTVDAPLDWYRLWENAMLVIRNQPAGASVAEARRIREALEALLGKQPTLSSRRYLSSSPLASKDREGGNARKLSGLAVRAYTEPDIQWWMDNRGADYYGMNALDAASLIRHLKLLRNTRAELIVTTGKGYRADGTRHPHSWSIVDQRDLARWLASELARQ
jgi:pimeloyl-ACP methyl ester carboxylesterase